MVDLTIILPDDPETRENILLYGAKQIAADGGAASKGATYAQRIDMMRDRWADVINGAWAFRDGHGAASKFPDADVFAALVAVGKIKITAEKPLAVRREMWAGLPQSARNKARIDPDVAKWIAAQSANDESAEDAYNEFLEN
jgi:hypothetical protein